MDKDKFLSVMVLVYNYLSENRDELIADRFDGYVKIEQYGLLRDDLEFELEEAKQELQRSPSCYAGRIAWKRRVVDLKRELHVVYDAIEQGRAKYFKANDYLELLHILPTLNQKRSTPVRYSDN